MYDLDKAKLYWKDRIIDGHGKLNTVLSYSESPIVNMYYDFWEKEVILKKLGSLSGKKILDIPAGIGRWTEVLAKKGGKITCVDICDEIIELLQKKLILYNYAIEYLVSDVSNLNLEKESFDVVLCTGLYEHLPEDLYTKTTETLSKVLKKNGKLVLVINNIDNPLIAQKSDNIFRLGKQLDNGYYCDLTRYDKVINSLLDNKICIQNYSFNTCYSIARQITKDIKDEKILENIYRNACKSDVDCFTNMSEINSTISDQIVIYGVKK